MAIYLSNGEKEKGNGIMKRLEKQCLMVIRSVHLSPLSAHCPGPLFADGSCFLVINLSLFSCDNLDMMLSYSYTLGSGKQLSDNESPTVA